MKNSFSKTAIEQLLQRSPELQRVDHLGLDWPEEVDISKEYLDAREIQDFHQLPEELTLDELDELNAKYKNLLKWKPLASTVSDHDISILEENWNLNIPEMLKDYLTSYALPLGFVTGQFISHIEYTYCNETKEYRDLEEDEKISLLGFQLCPMLWKKELDILKEENEVFEESGYIYLGTFFGNDYVFLDAESGCMIRVDHTSIRELTREGIEERSLPFFNTFHDFLRCFFLGDVYNLYQLQFI